MQVSKDEKCGLDRVKEKKNNQCFKRGLFTIIFDEFSSFSIRLIITIIQTICASF